MFKRTVPSTIFTYGTLIVLLFGTIVIGFIVRTIATSAYDTQFYANGGMGDYNPPSLEGLPYLFLVNPAVTMVSLVTGQFGNSSILREFLEIFGKVNPFLLDHWFGISVAIQMVVSIGLLYLSAKKLNPIRKSRKK